MSNSTNSHAIISRRECLGLIGAVSFCQRSPSSSVKNYLNSSAHWIEPGAVSDGFGNDLISTSLPGLTVKDGEYCKKGKPIRALGVNYFDCFLRMIATKGTEYEKAVDRCERGFDELSKLQIPFVRFCAGGFYPKDWTLHRNSPEEYYRRWDRLVKIAENTGIGLVPSLFWTFFTQPGLAKEPLSAWGDPASLTMANMRTYVDDLVQRSLWSEAIWGWEFGNEYNLDVDLPNQQMHLKHWYQEALGMPAAPGQLDFLKTEDIRIALDEFAIQIRKHDPSRPIWAGHAAPRASAWNLAESGSWDEDSADEWAAALTNQNPASLSGTSIHFYPFHGDGSGLKNQPGIETLELAASIAKRSAKPLWVGEFGPSAKVDADERFNQCIKIISWFQDVGVSLAAAWVYDYAPQVSHNLAIEENRPVLDLVSRTNRKWAEIS